MKQTILVEMTREELREIILQSLLEFQNGSTLKNESLGDSTEELMNIDQAAKFLSLSKSTMYSKVSKGELPFLKQSKRLYFLKEDLINHLKSSNLSTLD